jgi:NAD(P)H-quinone oxidoreductase subunit 5
MTNFDLLSLPLLLGSSCYLLSYLKPRRYALASTFSIFLSFIICLVSAFTTSAQLHLNYSFVLLTLFMSLIISKYSINYLSGERNQKQYYFYLNLLTFCLVEMIGSTSIYSLSIFFMLSNLLFSKLMMHKKNWKAAKAGAYYFLKTSIVSFLCLIAASIILTSQIGSQNITEIINKASMLSPIILLLVLILISTACLIQSGIWPFHNWVLSSLNSITPVTAFMHAGLITGGGIIMLRLYKLFLYSTLILETLFIFGSLSLIIGTLLKLSQNSLKKALASSTVAQMGFMFMQIGLGLPFAAFLHIIFHSLFKGFLFINSPSQINEKIVKKINPITPITVIFAFFAAAISTFLFQFTSKISIDFTNTVSLLLVFVFITSLQISFKIIKTSYLITSFTLALMITGFLGYLYGYSIHYLESFSPLFQAIQGLPITFLHIFMILAIVMLSLLINLKTFEKFNFFKKIYPRLYVLTINQGLSKSNTTNVVRTEYQN